jgi:small subunit ribosomal protein S16
MLKIRFQRIGRKKLPFFRIVVAEKARSAKAKFVEILGNFDPQTKELNLKKERIEHWILNGAKPSDRIAQILVKNGFKDCEKFVTERKMKPTRAEQKTAEEAKKAAEEKANEKAAEKSEKESAPAEKPAEEKSEDKSDSSKSDEGTNAEKSENKDESAEEKK